PRTEGQGDGLIRLKEAGTCRAAGGCLTRLSCEHRRVPATGHGHPRWPRLYRGMVTRLYTHPIYLKHLTPPGHPERPDRLRAIERILEDEAFALLDRYEAPD